MAIRPTILISNAPYILGDLVYSPERRTKYYISAHLVEKIQMLIQETLLNLLIAMFFLALQKLEILQKLLKQHLLILETKMHLVV